MNRTRRTRILMTKGGSPFLTELKTNTRKRDYHVAISVDGKTVATVTVRAEGVRDACKKAYETISGWQGVPPGEL